MCDSQDVSSSSARLRIIHQRGIRARRSAAVSNGLGRRANIEFSYQIHMYRPVSASGFTTRTSICSSPLPHQSSQPKAFHGLAAGTRKFSISKNASQIPLLGSGLRKDAVRLHLRTCRAIAEDTRSSAEKFIEDITLASPSEKEISQVRTQITALNEQVS